MQYYVAPHQGPPTRWFTVRDYWSHWVAAQYKSVLYYLVGSLKGCSANPCCLVHIARMESFKGWRKSIYNSTSLLPVYRRSRTGRVCTKRAFGSKKGNLSLLLPYDLNEQSCEEIFSRTHTYIAAGRYITLFALLSAILSDIRQPAERLLSVMEQKCERDVRFGKFYCDFLKEYKDLNYMELVPRSSNPQEQGKCYLSHRVFQESSVIIKLRVLFNRLQRTRWSDESLNS